jgi:hypothetical protein
MNTNRFSSLLAFGLLAANVTWAQNTATTTPVGYVTQTIPPNVFTYCGLTLHSPIIASGVITSSDASSVTQSGFNFDSILTAGDVYVLELENGTIQEVKSWDSSGRLVTSENISSQITDNVTEYSLRKAKTVNDVFGANNSFGLTSTDSEIQNADQIYLPTSSGTIIIYYYNDGSPDTGWYTSDGNLAGNLPIIYSDGFYIKRVNGDPVNIVLQGEVKTRPTAGVYTPGWNILSSVVPAGLTLQNSNLQNFITSSSDGDYLTVDNVYIPNGQSFDIVYYYNDGGPDTGWYTSAGDPAGNLALSGAFLILSRSGNAKPYTINFPTQPGN